MHKTRAGKHVHVSGGAPYEQYGLVCMHFCRQVGRGGPQSLDRVAANLRYLPTALRSITMLAAVSCRLSPASASRRLL